MDTPETYDVPALKAQLVEFLGPDTKYYPALLEHQFPRILSQIVKLWGQAELDAYLGELMLPARPGRQGFPAPIAMEIFHLANIHSGLNLTPTASGTGWSGIDDPERFKKAVSRE